MLVLIRRRQTQNAARYDRGLRRRAVSQDLAGGQPVDRESESLGGCWLRPENDTNKQSYGYKSTTDRGLNYCSLHLLEPALKRLANPRTPSHRNSSTANR